MDEILSLFEKEIRCSICLSTFDNSHSLPCNHIFCRGCILEAFKNKASCPLCLLPFYKRDLKKNNTLDNLVQVFKKLEEYRQSEAKERHLLTSKAGENSPVALLSGSQDLDSPAAETPKDGQQVGRIKRKRGVNSRFDSPVDFDNENGPNRILTRGETRIAQKLFSEREKERQRRERERQLDNENAPAKSNEDEHDSAPLDPSKMQLISAGMGNELLSNQCRTVEIEDIDPSAITLSERYPRRPTRPSLGDSSNIPSNVVLLGSSLSASMKSKLSKLCKLMEWKKSTKLDDTVTHLIVSEVDMITDRTIKYFLAVLSGMWILSHKWVEACSKKKGWVEENCFEIIGDSRATGAPSSGRIRKDKNLRPLFHGHYFFFYGVFYNPSQKDLLAIVSAGGGKTLTSLESVNSLRSLTSSSLVVIVPNPLIAKQPKLQAMLKNLSFTVQPVTYHWIFDCISFYKIQKFDNYLPSRMAHLISYNYTNENDRNENDKNEDENDKINLNKSDAEEDSNEEEEEEEEDVFVDRPFLEKSVKESSQKRKENAKQTHL